MRTREIMTSDPVVVTGDTPLRDAADLMRKYDVGALPVVTSRVVPRLSGVITDRDVVTRCVAAGHTSYCRVSEHMTTAPDSVLADADVSTVATIMSQERVRRLPVVDGDRMVIGMVSAADVARALVDSDTRRVAELFAALSTPSAERPAPAAARFYNPEEAEEGEEAFTRGLAVV